jgi:hypothetical protein
MSDEHTVAGCESVYAHNPNPAILAAKFQSRLERNGWTRTFAR